jgi:hypothetical protein
LLAILPEEPDQGSQVPNFKPSSDKRQAHWVCFLTCLGSRAPCGFVLGLFSNATHDLKDLMAWIWVCFGFVSWAKSLIPSNMMALFAPPGVPWTPFLRRFSFVGDHFARRRRGLACASLCAARWPILCGGALRIILPRWDACMASAGLRAVFGGAGYNLPS